jgi:hypothetical protein
MIKEYVLKSELTIDEKTNFCFILDCTFDANYDEFEECPKIKELKPILEKCNVNFKKN